MHADFELYTFAFVQEQVSRVGQILALTEILPTVHCVSPRETLQMMDEEGSSSKIEYNTPHMKLMLYHCAVLL